MKLVFLGTGGMVPTKERNVQGIYLEFNGEGILVDCGEGTQRQMNIAGINRIKVKKILISHWHGDHVSGLVGLIQTLGNIENPGTLDIYGPVESKEYINHILHSCSFDLRLDIRVHEIRPKGVEPLRFFENDDYYLEAVNLQHSIPCLGYALVQKDKRKINLSKATRLGLKEGPILGRLQDDETVEVDGKKITPDMVSSIKKGKKISFILDTEPTESINNLVRDSDIMVSEATFSSVLDEKAEQHKHMTAQVAAQIASRENVKKLILTHFSQRYKTVEELEDDAKKVFPETVCAFDFMKIKF